MSAEESVTSDEEDTYKEVSPCQRWHRKNIRLTDVPGIDALFQAMDMEEGVEVVWNEMNIPLVPLDDEGLIKLTEKLSKLSKIEHPNILKLYGSWYDKDNNKMVFITEYYTAGSLRKFMQRNFVNNKLVSTTVWKRWCRQVLSALSYLHSKDIAITHGFVTTDTVFIQHDGVVKLGSVAPSTIQDHIGTCSRTHRSRHRHYCAPEYGMSHVQKMVHRRSSSVDGKKASNSSSLKSLGSFSSLDSISELPFTPDVTQTKVIQRPFSVDIYAFGIFCLATLSDLEHSKESSKSVVISLDDVKHNITTLSHDQHRNLINLCINPDTAKRPSALTLLSLEVFYEIPPLKVMCISVIMSLSVNSEYIRSVEEKCRTDFHYKVNNEDTKDYIPQTVNIKKTYKDIKNGVYSVSNMDVRSRSLLSTDSKAVSTASSYYNGSLENNEDLVEEDSQGVIEEEHRLILTIRCQLNPSKVSGSLHLELEFQMSDNLQRVISTDIKETEDPGSIVDEIIKNGLLNKTDREMVYDSLVECLAT